MSAVLSIRDLVIRAETAAGEITLVDGLSFDVEPGAVTALVGESGCGKSMTALAVMGLLPPRVRVASGSILLSGRSLETLTEEEYLGIRGRRASMIFQEPMTSLNPLHTVGDQVSEVYRIHAKDDRRTARAKAVAMLERVRIPDPEKRAGQYPHQMSGGMRQRVMIAMALAAEPEILLADEPTTALDVTIQAQILDLLRDLASSGTSERRTAVLLITHDMGVVAETAERMVVMYSGREMEKGPVSSIFARPGHPYTKGLLAAIPRAGAKEERLNAIPGQVPRPGDRPEGCAFRPRCAWGEERCAAPVPLARRGGSGGETWVRCVKERLE